MTIRLKIFAISVLLLVLLAIALGISTWLQREVQEEFSGITEYHLPLTVTVAEIDVTTFEYELNLLRLLQHQETQTELLTTVQQREKVVISRLMTSFERAEDLLRRAIADMRNDLSDRLILARIEGRMEYLRRQARPFEALGKQILETYDTGNISGARALATGFSKFEEVFGPDLATIRTDLGTLTEASTLETLANENRLQYFGTILFAFAAMAGLGCSAVLAGRLGRAFRRLLEGAQSIEAGDLQTILPVRGNDEVSRLSAAFNRMSEQLRDTQRIKETFGKYVDPRIVGRLLETSGDNTDIAERRVVTVFFSDIQDFTSIGERLTAAAVANLLNHYFTVVATVISEYHGIIDKYMGDGVMAFWTSPFSSGDAHAADACLAALAQQQALLALYQELPNIVGLRRDVPKLKVRMGLATGETILGTLGSSTTKSFTVIGDTVNVASRLESINKIYGTTIVIAEDTERLAQAAVETRELDLITVVGKSEPVRIFEVLARSGELMDEEADLCITFALGLEAYRSRDWEKAAHQFNRCLEIRPHDGPASLFCRRIEELRHQPPPADWDGVWHMTQK